MIDSPPRAVYPTITWDQGAHTADHAAPALATGTGTKVYFADPHSPRRRPTNENTGGPVREYFPKGTSFNSIRPPPGPGRPGPAQPPPTRSLERTDPHRDTGHHHQRCNHPLTPPLLTLHCTRKRGASEGEGAQQTPPGPRAPSETWSRPATPSETWSRPATPSET